MCKSIPVPAVIFEVTSGSTRAVDLMQKKDLYEGTGVREYLTRLGSG
ncbi:MAG: hypothetical protein ACK4QL_00405 [Pseudanabaenaceae cyanobacterium]